MMCTLVSRLCASKTFAPIEITNSLSLMLLGAVLGSLLEVCAYCSKNMGKFPREIKLAFEK